MGSSLTNFSYLITSFFFFCSVYTVLTGSYFFIALLGIIFSGVGGVDTWSGSVLYYKFSGYVNKNCLVSTGTGDLGFFLTVVSFWQK